MKLQLTVLGLCLVGSTSFAITRPEVSDGCTAFMTVERIEDGVAIAQGTATCARIGEFATVATLSEISPEAAQAMVGKTFTLTASENELSVNFVENIGDHSPANVSLYALDSGDRLIQLAQMGGTSQTPGTSGPSVSPSTPGTSAPAIRETTPSTRPKLTPRTGTGERGKRLTWYQRMKVKAALARAKARARARQRVRERAPATAPVGPRSELHQLPGTAVTFTFRT